mgnify:CR=1 FL=1
MIAASIATIDHRHDGDRRNTLMDEWIDGSLYIFFGRAYITYTCISTMHAYSIVNGGRALKYHNQHLNAYIYTLG